MSPAVTSTLPPTQDERDLLQYQARIDRATPLKIPELNRDERLRHVIFSRQFSVDLLEDLAGTADLIRSLSKVRAGQDFLIGLLHHKRQWGGEEKDIVSYVADTHGGGRTMPCQRLRGSPAVKSIFRHLPAPLYRGLSRWGYRHWA